MKRPHDGFSGGILGYGSRTFSVGRAGSGTRDRRPVLCGVRVFSEKVRLDRDQQGASFSPRAVSRETGRDRDPLAGRVRIGR